MVCVVYANVCSVCSIMYCVYSVVCRCIVCSSCRNQFYELFSSQHPRRVYILLGFKLEPNMLKCVLVEDSCSRYLHAIYLHVNIWHVSVCL